mgnify:FL=1
MKKTGLKKHKWNIGIIAAFLVAIILFNQVPADASVTDNIQNCVAAILGHVDDKLSGTFEKSSTNGKLNQMKTDVDTVNTSLDQLISPYMSSLTVWVNDSNTAYNGMQVSITDSKGKVKTAGYVARNGHYEADFGNILRGSYTISYPYIVSGKTMKFSISSTLNAGENRKQLYGNIFQMSMAEIQNMCKAGVIHQMAHVGDTISDVTYTYTIIGINQDKPSDESGNLLPENSYGDVLTLMALGAPKGATNGQPVTMNASATPWGVNGAPMNSISSNSGSWVSSLMRNATMPEYLAKLPQATQNAIGYVQKVTDDGSTSSRSNSVTGDKCFLLSGKEIFGGSGAGNGSWCTTNEANATFQYQYFQSIATTPASRNINSSANQWWWLRSPSYNNSETFCTVCTGSPVNRSTRTSEDVFAAFCIY